jgi:hypothetical protein
MTLFWCYVTGDGVTRDGDTRDDAFGDFGYDGPFGTTTFGTTSLHHVYVTKRNKKKKKKMHVPMYVWAGPRGG